VLAEQQRQQLIVVELEMDGLSDLDRRWWRSQAEILSGMKVDAELGTAAPSRLVAVAATIRTS
jgi:hypothetical protein